MLSLWNDGVRIHAMNMNNTALRGDSIESICAPFNSEENEKRRDAERELRRKQDSVALNSSRC